MSDTAVAGTPQRDYSRARLNCDVVMKGGIASGIVYPGAVCELATVYRFKNIGGTSAGAIAAAAAAAAEYGRRHDAQGAGFHRLEGLPSELGEELGPGQGSRLLSLFQADAGTRRVFAPILEALAPERTLGGRLLAFVGAAGRQIWPAVLLGELPGLAIVASGVFSSFAVFGALAAILGAVLAVLGGVIGALVAWVVLAHRRVPANLFGLCSGFGGTEQKPALTPWLTDLLNELAGKDKSCPLTFGDLRPRGLSDDEGLSLKMVTTNLTLGRPYELPFRQQQLAEDHLDRSRYYFKVSEFERLFSPEVVHHLVAKAPHSYVTAEEEERFCSLPVVVATRLSLSFPVLLSAVPLYLLKPGRQGGIEKDFLKCWFSDGGICSNFPIHFFDAPLPRWPTFGINLRPLPKTRPCSPDECDDVFWPETDDERERGDRAKESFFTYWDGNESRGLLAFLGAVKDTTQNWHDSTLLSMPGYRDRVIHVGVRPGEGGLNLNMSEKLIRRLGDRGACAGASLIALFAGGEDQTHWDAHRWRRYRVAMAALERLITLLHAGYAAPSPAESLSYEQLVSRTPGAPPENEPWQPEIRERAIFESDRLTEMAGDWASAPIFERDVLETQPEYGLAPPL